MRLPEPIRIDLKTGSLGEDTRIERASKVLGEMGNVFADEWARNQMDAAIVVYAVEYWKPVAEDTEGGLYWGNSTVSPGVVGEEYFMTRGHFHARRDRAEYYATVSGTGLLVLMDEQRNGAVQEMEPGTTHYIPGRIAHRVVNIGDVPLTFLACWPSDAGYDYATIDEQGFSVRVFCRGGRPEVVAQS
jgi:glucose-6-phosphate isomerase, archaeal